MENLKDKAIVWTVGSIAYLVAAMILIFACLANLGSLLFLRLQSFLPD